MRYYDVNFDSPNKYIYIYIYLCEVVLGQVQFCQVVQILQLSTDQRDVITLKKQHLKHNQYLLRTQLMNHN